MAGKKAIRTKDAVLTESAIIKAAKAFFKRRKRWPTQTSTEPVPGRAGDTWHAIHAAGQQGHRGLIRGRTLSKILAEVKPDNLLTEEAIIAAAKRYFKIYKRWPNAYNKEAVPGINGKKWCTVNEAGRLGYGGLAKGRTLAKILKDIKPTNNLSEEEIIQAANVYFKLYGRWPNQRSQEPVPILDGTTWGGIDAAGYSGGRGLTKGRTLSKILKPLKHQED